MSWYSPGHARLAQLVEHFLDVDGVGGSSPSPRTVYEAPQKKARKDLYLREARAH